MLLGTSMDCESADSRSKGCWDPVPFFKPLLARWTSKVPTPDFTPDEEWVAACTGLGFGSAGTPENTEFWTRTMKEVYKGDGGRRKLKMAVICLADRDSLLLRLDYIECPVHWLHVSPPHDQTPVMLPKGSFIRSQGTSDPVYSTKIAEEQIQLFTSSKDAKVDLVQGGAHYLSASNPVEVNRALLSLVQG